MKIPKSIRIAGKDYKILVSNEDAHREGVHGRIEYAGCRIILEDPKKTSTSRQKIEQTLIHEIIHACNNILGKNGEHNSEDYVNPLSELLYQVFKQLEGK